jgi:hypothetical protein
METKSKWQKIKKNKIKNCKATSIISNNNPGMLIAENKNTKRNHFLPKMSWIGGLR